MKAALFALLALMACVAALSVSAQNIVVPAPPPVLDPATGLPVQTEATVVMGRMPRGLKLRKPRIFAPTVAAAAASTAAAASDEPIIGKAPANLKKSAVSEHIYGGGVQYELGREVTGCPCKRAVPEKYRYDARWKREARKLPCPCAGLLQQQQKKTEEELLPVVARLYREPKPAALLSNVTLPCNGTHTLLPNGTLILMGPQVPKPVEQVAPDYYRFPRDMAERIQKRIAATQAALKAPCTNCAQLQSLLAPQPPKPETVTPQFYPTLAQRRERRRARRAAAREAARKAAAAAATKQF